MNKLVGHPYALVLLLMAVLCLQTTHAQIPHALSYQGILADSSGTPKPDGSYTFTFRLYDVSSGGSALWSETQSAQVKHGLFSAILGSVNPIPDSVRFDRQYWLGIVVGSDPELIPRLKLSSVGSSFSSIHADTAQNLPDNSVSEEKIEGGQVVKSINNLHDHLTMRGANGASVTSNGDTITITASGGGGGGISTIQNTDNTLSITNPGGPTTTINLQSPFLINGTVGIGTSSPASKLDVNGGSGTGANVGIHGSSNDNYGIYGTSNNSYGVFGESAGSNAVYARSYAAGAYALLAGHGLGNANYCGLASGSYALVANGPSIFSTDVGIGTFSPTDGRLDVVSSGGVPAIYGLNSTTGAYGISGLSNAGLYGHASTSMEKGVWGWNYNGGYGVYCTGNFGQGTGSFQAFPTTTTWSSNLPVTVKLDDGEKVKVFTEGSAEVYFSDYGDARLVSGHAHVELDPTFLQTVTVNPSHPMRVFIQLTDDCNGVFVANRTETGFDVRELKDGTSYASFSYRVVCKRKYYEDERLATEDEDIRFNTKALETLWPEVVANAQREKEHMDTTLRNNRQTSK